MGTAVGANGQPGAVSPWGRVITDLGVIGLVLILTGVMVGRMVSGEI